MTVEAQQSRVDAVIRLAGLIVSLFGVAMIYYTYVNVSYIVSDIAVIDYALGVLLLIVGLFALLAKFK